MRLANLRCDMFILPSSLEGTYKVPQVGLSVWNFKLPKGYIRNSVYKPQRLFGIAVYCFSKVISLEFEYIYGGDI